MNRLSYLFNEQILKLKRNPSLLAPVLAFGAVNFFLFLVMFGNQTYLSDDWTWLAHILQKPSFGWTEPYIFSRMPIATVLLVGSLKLGLWEQVPKLALAFFYGIHVLGFGFLLKTLIELEGDSGSNGKKQIQILPFLLVGMVFSFLPVNYEIHLWHFNSMFCVGTLFLAGAFLLKRSRLNHFIAVGFFVALSFLVYDSFIFLFLGFSALWVVVEAPEEVFVRKFFEERGFLRKLLLGKQARNFIALFLFVFIVVVGVKAALTKMTGIGRGIHLDLELRVILDHLKVVLRTLWFVHFYKANWVFTVIQWIAWILICLQAIQTKKLPYPKLFTLLAIPTAVALPLALNPYPAPRAYYGPQVLQALVFAYLSYLALASEAGFAKKSRVYRYFPIVLLAVVYCAQWGWILYIKNQNYNTLLVEESRVVEKMRNCPLPCVLVMPPPGKGIRTDNVLPELAWTAFYERIHFLRAPEKNIEFVIQADVDPTSTRPYQ